MHGYLATSRHRPKPVVPVKDLHREVLDSGGGELAVIMRALADPGWNGVSLCTVLESIPKLYVGYREGLRYRDETMCWREAYSKLGARQPRETDGDITGYSRLQLGKADRLRENVSRSRADPDNARGKVANARNGTVALLRDLMSAQQ